MDFKVSSPLNDKELLDLCKSGDRSAFKFIYDKYWLTLYSFSLRLVCDEQESEDIIQDVFIILWKKNLESEILNLSAFLYKCTRNRILKYFEKSKSRTNYIDSFSSFLETATPSLDLEILANELERAFEKEKSLLPEKMREIYTLREQEYSYKEISDLLSISENTVRKQLNNARRTLKAKLSSFFTIFL
ncbi:RNA polymerase sigma factor [Parapedobacter tibetensis]|uniref:RNA polymerase sigma factor n=1 Tax=Parapedobacter tibetensis TaxID=2972951 RepID=UPI00214DA0F4|nr:sigma-70 family RNA polymerase sigma factor [Parapedobacter tibetensis]